MYGLNIQLFNIYGNPHSISGEEGWTAATRTAACPVAKWLQIFQIYRSLSSCKIYCKCIASLHHLWQPNLKWSGKVFGECQGGSGNVVHFPQTMSTYLADAKRCNMSIPCLRDLPDCPWMRELVSGGFDLKMGRLSVLWWRGVINLNLQYF